MIFSNLNDISGPLQDLSDGSEEPKGAAGKISAEPQSQSRCEISGDKNTSKLKHNQIQNNILAILHILN